MITNSVARRLIVEDIEKVFTGFSIKDPDLYKARFFMTGGTGFVGIWLLETLLHLSDQYRWGIEITVLTRNPESFSHKCPELTQRVEMLQGDVTDFVFPAGEYQYIIHAATDTSSKVNRNVPIALLDSIILGTRRVAEFAAFCGCKKFLYVSSGAAYGPQPAGMTHIEESYPGAPVLMNPTGNTLYGEAKRSAELISLLFAKEHSFEVKIARLFAFVGPYLPLDAHFAIGNFIGDALASRDIIIKGDGSPFRSYMYAADMALWLVKILFDGDSRSTYNVGSNEGITILEAAHCVAGCSPTPLGVNVMGVATGHPPERYVPCARKAKKDLALSTHFTLREAVERTIKWHLSF